jgi:MoaA/NifB/PqqE/SkfB family radical SAM enzyme
MQPIEQVISDLERGLAQALAEGEALPSLLSDPGRLLAVVADGEARRVASQERLGVPVPRFCLFSVTWRCNLNCVGCYAKNYTRGRELSPEEIRRVLAEAAELGSTFFVIVGGEPLTVPGIIDMLAERQDALFFLFTNGTLLQEHHAEAVLRAGNILPIVSVEGDRTLTDYRRGGGTGEKVARAMAILQQANVAFGFSAMVTHRNLRTVTSRQWFDQLWDAGARYGYLIDYIPFPRGLDASLVLTNEDRTLKTGLVLERQQEARPLVLNFPPDEYATGGCQSAGRSFLHINADGFVEPCPFSHWAVDNLRDTSLAGALSSEFFCRLRETFADEPNPLGECLLFARGDEVAELAAASGAFATEDLPL